MPDHRAVCLLELTARLVELFQEGVGAASVLAEFSDEALLFIRRDVGKVLKVVCQADLGFSCLMSSWCLVKEFVK